ncbi:MAG: hypothetical protein JXA43_02670 [Candidatus Diapherotrites archaeon]|nr:hypothetical protein [Candidatus Diapherotrites archaeon]
MNALLKNWKVRILLLSLVIAILLITFNGISLGIDFKGGTLFQIHLAQKATPQQMQTIASVVSQRVDGLGLQGASVTPWGNEFVLVSLSETNPDKINQIENLLSKQGKLEMILNKEVIFTGSGISNIDETSAYYGVAQASEDAYKWTLPFSLTPSAAKAFADASYGRCVGDVCDVTYFFIDRPIESVLIIPADVYMLEDDALSNENTTADELIENSGIKTIVFTGEFNEEDINSLTTLVSDHPIAYVHPSLGNVVDTQLSAIGYDVETVEPASNGSWLWGATRTRAVISLTPGVANIGVAKEDMQILQDLIITGHAVTSDEAVERLDEMRIILRSGSMPIPVSDISKNSITPALGQNFLQNTLVAGLLALVTVAIVIFVRYRRIRLMLPIVATGFFEIILILGFASLVNWSLDLAAMAGIIAAVGTGVDHQIIITDELLRRKQEEQYTGSLKEKIGRAFFIIFAASATAIAAMFPIIFFGLGMGRLTGFAIVTIAGVLIGVFIARPAYAEFAKYIISHTGESAGRIKTRAERRQEEKQKEQN